MKYPENLRVIVDVTKPPYCADNTGRMDCTEILKRAVDDVVSRDVQGVKDTWDKLRAMNPGEKDAYIGFQSRRIGDYYNVSYSEDLPPSRIIWFPKGTYLVSDTISYITDKSKKVNDSKYWLELNRGIHFEGEDREETVIKLKDNCPGYEYGQIRPVVSYIQRNESMINDPANNAMLNTFENITIDCGSGNPGAVGLKFHASNIGRISNVTIKSSDARHRGLAGLFMTAAVVAAVDNVLIDGFDYGALLMSANRELYENVEFKNQLRAAVFSQNSICNLRNVISDGTVPTYLADANGTSNASIIDNAGDNKISDGFNFVYKRQAGVESCCRKTLRLSDTKTDKLSLNMPFEETPQIKYPPVSEWVCVDDFGAAGDGITDSTEAIQKAFDSGAKVIYFNEGRYLINDEILIPSTVEIVNFAYCDFAAGEKLIKGKGLGAFVVSEDSDKPVMLTKVFTWEKFYGFFHFVRHSAKRDVILKDLHIQTACVYFNTVCGSRVFADNVACTTGDFSQWYLYVRPGEPILSANIPFEFHGQRVYAKNLNPERADIEILNDNSELTIYGLYVEGPGTAVKTVNGGRTEVITFTAGIGIDAEDTPLFINDNSDVSVTAGRVSGFAGHSYPVIVRETYGSKTQEIRFEDLHVINPYRAVFGGYIGECKNE